MAQIPLPDAARIRLSIYRDELSEFAHTAKAANAMATSVNERLQVHFTRTCKELGLPETAVLDMDTWSIKYPDPEVGGAEVGAPEGGLEEALAGPEERDDSSEV